MLYRVETDNHKLTEGRQTISVQKNLIRGVIFTGLMMEYGSTTSNLSEKIMIILIQKWRGQ